MIFNLSKYGTGGNTAISSYNKVKVVDHKPDNRLLMLRLQTGDLLEFEYEQLEETSIIINAEYQIFILEYKGKKENGDVLSGIQFTELYPVLK
mgnify:CR=1 FL=1